MTLFQQHYPVTNATHLAYSLDSQNGVVDQYTLLGLDEALMEGWKIQSKKMRLSSRGKTLLKKIEKLRLKPYDDQSGKEISTYVKGATIGYGYLISQNEWDSYKKGINIDTAESLLDKKIDIFEGNLVGKIAQEITQQEYDALFLLSYNIGVSNFNSSSVLKIVNGGIAPAYDNDLEKAWLAWNKSQDKIMEGLKNRRRCELNIYYNGVYKGW